MAIINCPNTSMGMPVSACRTNPIICSSLNLLVLVSILLRVDGLLGEMTCTVDGRQFSSKGPVAKARCEGPLLAHLAPSTQDNDISPRIAANPRRRLVVRGFGVTCRPARRLRLRVGIWSRCEPRVHQGVNQGRLILLNSQAFAAVQYQVSLVTLGDP